MGLVSVNKYGRCDGVCEMVRRAIQVSIKIRCCVRNTPCSRLI